jgi:DNA repair protein RecO (recombination protein O)
MKQVRSEGIVLHSFDYKERERIVSVFTLKEGMISLIIKRLSKNKPALINLTSPLCQAEFLYQKGKSDLYRFIDGTILNLHLPLRRSYHHLQYGGKMIQAIRSSQMPGKRAPALYCLLLSYLKKLPEFEKPEILWTSFQLKLLKHEGLLSLTKQCTTCKEKPALRLVEGESFCPSCAPSSSYPFSEKEWAELFILTHSRTFAHFYDLDGFQDDAHIIPSSVIEKKKTFMRGNDDPYQRSKSFENK